MSGLRFTGALDALSPPDLRALLERSAPAGDPAVAAEVAALLDDVRRRGDAALRDQAARFDGGAREVLEVPRRTLVRALDALPRDLRRALDHAMRNLTVAHRAQRPAPVELETEPGVRVVRRPDPLRSAGVYAPGGRAAYPSSVLMGVVPAKVAGVREVVVCTPPRSGEPAGIVLAAAQLAGADRVFAAGGAGAIAALAFGTRSVPAVERIVGPGNAWVAEAKRQVQGRVPIDVAAGPSELLVIADASAEPAGVARELAGQAEHDPDAAAIAVVVDRDVAGEVARELEALAARCGRREVVIAALARGGGVLVARDLDEAVDFANAYAPEHLLLATADSRAVAARIRGAGCVFLGSPSSVVFGDYLAGANHVLPTAGAARCGSGLSVLDFVRWTSLVEVTATGAAALAADTAALAAAEGLPGHAAAANAWRLP